MKNREDPHTKNEEGCQLQDKDLYRVALETRNLELALFWQRSNYFLVLNTALALGFFNVKSYFDALVLSGVGCLVSVLWLLMNAGSKFWQSRWEHRLRLVEQHLAPGADLFSADWPTIRDDVRKSLASSRHSVFRKPFDALVLKKPSVTFLMVLLSFLFILGWTILFVLKFINLKATPVTLLIKCTAFNLFL
jgi:hypothetical protein